jgi:LacI family transcriptional regulator
MITFENVVKQQRQYLWYNAASEVRDLKFKDILILVNVTATDAVYPTLIQYAREHRWRLTIEDRMAPPQGWRGDGAIVEAIDGSVTSRYVRSLARHGIPVVNLVESNPRDPIASCVLDVRKSADMAAAHFLRLGFRHAAFFSMEWFAERKTSCTAFTEAMVKCDILKWCWPLETGARRTSNRAAMTRWIQNCLKNAPKPLAVFCPNSYNAVTFLNICLDMGITVPDEVAIVCDKYDPVFCDCQAVPITGIEFNSSKKADEAAKLLDRLIDGDLPAPMHVTIPPERIAVQQSTDVIATENPLLRQALQFIRDNLTKPFGVGEIAAALGIARIRVNPLFTSELKRTVGAEILRQRIVKAKKLLIETDSTLEYIANECGFCHSSYFVNIFKRTTGLTPRRYRIQEQGKNTLRL